MFEDYVIPTRRRTADDVLATLVAYHNQWMRTPEMQARYPLTMETTIWDWCSYDLIDFPMHLRKGYNRFFRVDISPQQWRSLIEPEKKRTVGGLCRAIADAGSTMDLIEPLPVFGQPCRAAAVFAMLVTKLRRAGVSAEDVTPSSPLSPIATTAKPIFQEFAMVEPTLLRRMRSPGATAAASITWGVALALSISAMILLVAFAVPIPTSLLAILFLLTLYLFAWLIAPASETHVGLHFVGLKTVADFCRAVATPSDLQTPDATSSLRQV